MTDTRIDPPFIAGELDMLTSWLDWHRETLALKCAGLTAEQLRERSAPPSTLSLLGLVRHMADVERNWFRKVFAGEDAPPFYFTDDDPDGDFDNVDDASPDEAFSTWREQIDLARAITATAADLDQVGKVQRHGGDVGLRWILVHMIEEYARHNGHADILRERIDGATGD